MTKDNSKLDDAVTEFLNAAGFQPGEVLSFTVTPQRLTFRVYKRDEKHQIIFDHLGQAKTKTEVFER